MALGDASANVGVHIAVTTNIDEMLAKVRAGTDKTAAASKRMGDDMESSFKRIGQSAKIAMSLFVGAELIGAIRRIPVAIGEVAAEMDKLTAGANKSAKAFLQAKESASGFFADFAMSLLENPLLQNAIDQYKYLFGGGLSEKMRKLSRETSLGALKDQLSGVEASITAGEKYFEDEYKRKGEKPAAVAIWESVFGTDKDIYAQIEDGEKMASAIRERIKQVEKLAKDAKKTRDGIASSVRGKMSANQLIMAAMSEDLLNTNIGGAGEVRDLGTEEIMGGPSVRKLHEGKFNEIAQNVGSEFDAIARQAASSWNDLFLSIGAGGESLADSLKASFGSFATFATQQLSQLAMASIGGPLGIVAGLGIGAVGGLISGLFRRRPSSSQPVNSGIAKDREWRSIDPSRTVRKAEAVNNIVINIGNNLDSAETIGARIYGMLNAGRRAGFVPQGGF